jgi:hypothetical protein
MVNVFALSVVDCWFIDGVMVANHYTIDEPTIYLTQGENTNNYTISSVV